MSWGGLLFSIMIVGILGLVFYATYIDSTTPNEFCEKHGYERHTYIQNFRNCIKETNGYMEKKEIYCTNILNMKCYFVKEATVV